MRLLNGKQFSTVFDTKRRLHGACFSLHVASNEFGYARLGLAVSRRVSKKAVERNRLKRIVRDSFRHHQHELGSIDYVVVAKITAVERSTTGNQALRLELERAWVKAKAKIMNPSEV